MTEQLSHIVEESQRMQAQEDWNHVWNSWIDILDHMEQLYADVPMELSEFCTIFLALTKHIQRVVPPRTLDAVMISQGSTARLNAPKSSFSLVFVKELFRLLQAEMASFQRRLFEDGKGENPSRQAKGSTNGGCTPCCL